MQDPTCETSYMGVPRTAKSWQRLILTDVIIGLDGINVH